MPTTFSILYHCCTDFLDVYLGYSQSLFIKVSALLWACLLTLISYIIFSIYSVKPNHAVILRLCLAIVLCFSSCYFLQDNKIFIGAHFDIILIGFFYMCVIAKEIESCKNATDQLVIASVLLVLVLLSDELTLVFIVLPILACLFLNLFFLPAEEQRKRYLANI